LNESRDERRRAIVLGRVRLRALPPQFWLWTAALLGGFAVFYWKYAQGQVERAKSAVMAKQRAIAQSLGPKILPFRDSVESWARELAKDPWPGDHVSGDADLDRITKSAGVYLRLRQANTKTVKEIRKAAVASLHDGFTSCFFVRDKPHDPTLGPSCKNPGDCAPGLLCNEWDVCAAPVTPYNMRLAYRSLRVLSTEWTDELHGATSELAVTAYERDLQKVTGHDVPIAVDLLTRAKYVTIVLDEPVPFGVPDPVDAGDETAEERVQRLPHWARVAVWDLKSGSQLMRVRAEAAGRLRPVGPRQNPGQQSVAAQRQANSCALALEVKQALLRGASARGGVPVPTP
jgi:hypothetical protein